MVQKKHRLTPTLEFYITNVCNLECRGCNRFNNYKFKGHQYWNEWADSYSQWAKRLDAPRISILGGEPFLNPDIELWASNLRRLWPNSLIQIQTNGTRFSEEYLEWWHTYGVGLGISLHDKSTAEAQRILWRNDPGLIEAFVFHQSAVIKQDKTFKLHTSNPVNAFQSCGMKYDHTMYKGKLWKCPTMAILPDFIQQFDVTLTEQQRALLDAFKPLTADCSDEELQDFIDSKDTPIPQCEFCPQNLKWQTALGPLEDNLPNPDFPPPITDEEIQKQLTTVNK